MGKPSTLGVSSTSGGPSMHRELGNVPRSVSEVLTSLVTSFPDSARSKACLSAEVSILRNQAYMMKEYSLYGSLG